MRLAESLRLPDGLDSVELGRFVKEFLSAASTIVGDNSPRTVRMAVFEKLSEAVDPVKRCNWHYDFQGRDVAEALLAIEEGARNFLSLPLPGL